MSVFRSDTDFCSECGSILPLPGNTDVVCKVCQHTISVKAFDGKKIASKIFYNDVDKILENKYRRITDDGPCGTLVDRKCAKCGNEGMTYATLQTRSADEGQTVFYSCPRCGFQENENS